jgi:hypothetical protein
MRVLSHLRAALVLAAFATAATAALAQDPTPAARPPARTGTIDRLFFSFAQDAAIVPSQWWEGQIEYQNGSSGVPVDALILNGVFAFQPVRRLEVGGSIGLGNTNADPGLPDGTGATDLNVYGKWMFENVSTNLDFAAGLLATIPTGDDTVGLGYNSFGEELFGSMRYRMDGAIIGSQIGVRFNGDGEFMGANLEGKTSFELGMSALFPMANQVTITAEAQIETARFDGLDSTANLVGGVNWRAFKRGMFRGALAAGLTDATPNFRVLASYVYAF